MPAMNPNKSNDFLSMNRHPANMDDAEEDDFDMAMFSAMRKQQKEQLEHLDHEHDKKQIEIDQRIRGEHDRLFAQFQQAMQQVYSALTHTVSVTIENQVKLRMEQERLHEEHASQKRDIARRYHNEASRLVMSTSRSTRVPAQNSLHKPYPKPSSGSSTTPSQPATNGEHHGSSAISSPSIHHRAVSRPMPEPIPQAQRQEQLSPRPIPSQKHLSQSSRQQEQAVCQQALSQQTLPSQARPPQALHSQTLPSQALSSQVLPQQAAPQHVLPKQRKPVPSEPRSVNAIPARHTYEEPVPVVSHPPANASSQQNQMKRTAHVPAPNPVALPLQKETKRKAAGTPTDDVVTSKRPRADGTLGGDAHGEFSSPQNKDLRILQSPSTVAESRAERTISFEEVYQGGKAQYKHKIIEYRPHSGNWYIVRCDEHNVHFGYGNPVHGAAKHIHSPQHGHMEKRHDLAIGVCGHRVTGCNAKLAELNNREFERAVKEDKYVVFNLNLLTKEGRRRLTGHAGETTETTVVGENRPDNNDDKKKPKSRDGKPSGEIITPQECKFYEGFWQPTKKWYMLIVLPIRPDGSLREVGLKEKLQQTELMSTVPKCYRVDRVSLQIKGWQAAYEDGGTKVNKREFPVMFFDGFTKHSLGWLTAHKLRPVDLDDPSEDVNKKGLSTARDWYAQRMMNRRNWEEFKTLGPGEPRSATASDEDTDRNDLVPLLRSAHKQDDQSPIRDKSSKPESFNTDSSSDDGSDEEGPTEMDVEPVRETTDSNHIGDSVSEASDIEMQDARDEDGISRTRRPSKAETATPPQQPSSRHDHGNKTSSEAVPTQDDAATQTKNGESLPGQSGASRADEQQKQPDESVPEAGQLTPPTSDVADQRDRSAILSEQEYLRKSAQAKAAAAVKEAASRSRASSEVPETVPKDPAVPSQQARSEFPTRSSFTDHNRSRSEDNSPLQNGTSLAAYGLGKLKEGRKPADLHNILNNDNSSTVAEPNEDHANPYKRFEAIKAQMQVDVLKSRAVSAPVHEVRGVSSPFPPPPMQPVQPKEVLMRSPKKSPSIPRVLSPPVMSPTIIPSRSASSTPVQGLESGRSTPKIVIPGNSDKWQAVRKVLGASQQQSPDSRAPFDDTPATIAVNETTNINSKTVLQPQPTMPQSHAQPISRVGTPILEKKETFDIAQFQDRAQGLRWTRDGPGDVYLRLKTDATRGLAETVSGMPLTAAVEPSKVTKIEVDALNGDKERPRLQLFLTDGNKQTVVFESNSESGRLQGAQVQVRLFVAWVKKINGDVEYRNGADSRRSSIMALDDRRSTTAGLE